LPDEARLLRRWRFCIDADRGEGEYGALESPRAG